MTLKIERELVEARCAAEAAGDELFVRACQLSGIAAVLTAVPCTVEVDFKSTAWPISRTEGGYPLTSMYFSI